MAAATVAPRWPALYYPVRLPSLRHLRQNKIDLIIVLYIAFFVVSASQSGHCLWSMYQILVSVAALEVVRISSLHIASFYTSL